MVGTWYGITWLKYFLIWYLVEVPIGDLGALFVHGWNMVWHHLVEVLLDMVFD